MTIATAMKGITQMNKSTIDMAREAGFRVGPSRDGPDEVRGAGLNLRWFEALVRADERGRMCEQLKECLSEKPTSNEANRSEVLGEGG
jgi:hypothetical protein